MQKEQTAGTTKRSSSKKHLVVGIIMTVLMALVAFVEPGFMSQLELKLLDLRFAIRGENPHENQVVIVDIDDRSLAKIGKWPWKRTIFADLIDQLNAAGAKVIAFDIYFQKDDTKPIDSDDIQFADKMKTRGNVILPIYFNLNKQELVSPETVLLKNFAYPQTTNIEELDQYALIQGYDLFASSKDLTQASFGAGHINIIPDPDGVTRKEIMALEHQHHLFPSLGLRAVQKYFADTHNALELDGAGGIQVGDRFIPVTPVPMGGALVWGVKYTNYRGGYKSFRYYSVIDVLQKRFPNNAFLNKIVIVGSTSPGLYDTLATPYANIFPGVERHAHVIDNILQEDFITRPVYSDILVILFCLAFGLIITLVFPKLNIIPQILILFCLSIAYFFCSHILFIKYATWLTLIYPILTLWLVALPVLFLLLSETKKEHAEVKEESHEAIKMLGLSFMEKGLFEMAYDHFSKLPLTADIMRILYNLANELARKRKNALAIQIYKDLYAEDRLFENVAVRLKELGVDIVEEPKKHVVRGTTFVEDLSIADQQTTLQNGQTLGRYEVTKMLGQGAMGVVYLGKDPTLERPVALKTFKFSDFADDTQLEKIKANFLREARLAGKLNHPNIVTIFDAGEDWDLSYIAMEVLEGKELKECCVKPHLLPPAKVVGVVSLISQALDYAHKNGVIHRDVKPANIMITKGGIIKITDFGIALAVGEIAGIAGTPFYMAPEQFKGQAVDGRTDLYALGVIFYEMLTGHKPWQASDFESLKQKILNQPVSDLIRASVPGSSQLHAVIAKLLAKEKGDRFATGKELAMVLRKIATQQPSRPTTETDKTLVLEINKTPVEDATVSLEEKTISEDALAKPPGDIEATIADGEPGFKKKD